MQRHDVAAPPTGTDASAGTFPNRTQHDVNSMIIGGSFKSLSDSSALQPLAGLISNLVGLVVAKSARLGDPVLGGGGGGGGGGGHNLKGGGKKS